MSDLTTLRKVTSRLGITCLKVRASERARNRKKNKNKEESNLKK